MEHSEQRGSLKKRIILMVIALLFVFGSIFGWGIVRDYLGKQYMASFRPPPITVSSEKVQQQDWQPYINAVGVVESANAVDVSTEAAGIIEEIYVQSGQHVKKGTPLIRLDDRIDQQDLKNNQAELKLSKLSYERQATLYKKRSAAKTALDQAQASLSKAEAMVTKSKATIAEKHINAPFSGKVGIVKLNVGQYVTPGDKLLNVQSQDPMYVRFTVPSQELPRIRPHQVVQITVDTYPGKAFTGHISALNATVNKNTGNILIQATFPNKHGKLYPGLFANVQILLPKVKHVLTVPQTAITYTLYGDSVYTIKKEKGKLTAKLNMVKTGEQRDGKTIILSGIKKGEEVITTGQLKLHNNAEIKINNTVKLKPKKLTIR